MKESELAKIFIDYFNDGYEVYEEVPAGTGIVDFVATDGKIFIGCEVKCSFGLSVIKQAFKRRFQFHYTYICVPRTRSNTKFREMICKDYNIGVLKAIEGYNNDYSIIETVKPKLQRKITPPKLEEYMKQSTAGSRSDRVTAFGHTVNQIKKHLERHGDSHINDILGNIDYHYNTLSTAKSSLRKWINTGVIKGIEWDNAILSLNGTDK